MAEERGLRVLVVGGVACGSKAAARLKRLMPDASITIIDRSSYISYGSCGIPYYVEGLFDDVMVLNETPVGVRRTPQFFEQVKGVKVLTRTEALSIDPISKTLRIRNLDTGEEKDLPYDKLILATGARALRPSVPGIDLQRVWTVRNLDDAEAIRFAIERDGLKKAVVIGGGYIGLEMAEALTLRGLEVTVVEMMPHLLPHMLDLELALLLENHIRQKGVRLLLNERLQAINGSGTVNSVTTDKRTIEADLVIISIGVKPNDQLAREAGLSCDPKGGIIINNYCQTSDPDIYAGGDCVLNSYIHPFTERPIYVPLGSTANKHGRVIANHIAGIITPFPGIIATSLCRIFDFNIGCAGITQKLANELRLDVETALWAGPDKSHYMNGNPLIIKLIASKRYRILLGCEIIGPGDVSKRLDVAVTAISLGASLDHIAYLDLGYAPPFAPPIDPLLTATHVLLNKMNGLAKGLNPREAYRLMQEREDLILLDVRTPQEFSELRLNDPRVVHIPLGMLRQRARELPKDKIILSFCKVSLRGYEAQRILNAEGFDKVWFIEGGLMAWPFGNLISS
ncbi:MAG: FAD-dependent oxidoreductase [Syntrophobacterales bacterium]|nr:FAD-dependent oxidoreductase [Syntrophobacterales bacterium]